MFILINAFLIGTASGLRALIGLAAVSWAVRFGILPLDHTWLAFLGYAFTPYILTLMAIGELVNDKLPKFSCTRTSGPFSVAGDQILKAFRSGRSENKSRISCSSPKQFGAAP